jgi:ABC-type glycerol-3-phosphate transport system substrate-binding protein
MDKRFFAVASLMVAATTLLAACAPAAATTPMTIEVTRIVEGTPQKVEVTRVVQATPVPPTDDPNKGVMTISKEQQSS